MNGLFYLKAVLRDDGKRFSFDGTQVVLSDDNQLATRPTVSSTDLEYTEINGGEMIAQRYSTYTQSYNGYLVAKSSTIWDLVNKFNSFFIAGHNYQLITVRADGDMMSRRSAWLNDGSAPQCDIVANETYATFSIEFKVGDSNTYEYAEDANGNEIYANSVELQLATASAGGLVWDDTGVVWDEVGAEWESGGGGIKDITVNSSTKVYPVWIINGPCANPKLTNNTTDTTASYNGTIADGQTLIVDMSDGSAKLNSAVVSRNLVGQVSFAPGVNSVAFDSGGGSAKLSTINWNNILG